MFNYGRRCKEIGNEAHRERKLKCDKRGKRGGGAGSLKRERGEIKTYDLTLIVL